MRIFIVAISVLVIGVNAVACSSGPGASGGADSGTSVDGAATGSSDATTAEPTSDAGAEASSDAALYSDADAGEITDASIIDADAAGDASSDPTPRVRLVNLIRPPFGLWRANVCARRHGDAQNATPLFPTALGYGFITNYATLTPGTYDFRIVAVPGNLPLPDNDCLTDAGSVLDGLTDVDVAGPLTLTVQTREIGGGLSMLAFADTATPVAGMANIRARNAGTTNGLTFKARSLTNSAEVLLGPVPPNEQSLMQPLIPDQWNFSIPGKFQNETFSATPFPTTTAGTWDLFAHPYGTDRRFIVCRESSEPTSECTLGN